MPSVCDGPEGLMMSSDSSLACGSDHIQACQISTNSLGRGGNFLDVFSVFGSLRHYSILLMF